MRIYVRKKYENIEKLFKENAGYAKTKDILAYGIHARDIQAVREDGMISKVKSGLYKLSGYSVVSNDDFIDVSRAVPGGVICLLSALSYYELTTFIPPVVSIALQRNTWTPKIEYPPVKVYHFSKKQYEAGIEEIDDNGNRFHIYNREKTICDCVRYRNKLGIDTAKEGLTEYLRRKDRKLEKLMEYAEIGRIKPLMKTWLTMMV